MPSIYVKDVAELRAILTADISQFTATLGQAKSYMARTADEINREQQRILGGLGGGPSSGGINRVVSEGGGFEVFGGRLLARIALYKAVYTAASSVRSLIEGSINRAADLVSEGEQTGLGVTGAQRLERAAFSTNTSVTNVASAIARFRAQVDQMSLSTVKAFDDIGVKASWVKGVIGTDLDGVLKEVISKVQKTGDMGAFAELFGSRGGRSLQTLQSYTSGLDKTVRLSQQEAENVAKIRSAWVGVVSAMEDYFSKYLSHAISLGERTGSGAQQSKLATLLGLDKSRSSLTGQLLDLMGAGVELADPSGASSMLLRSLMKGAKFPSQGKDIDLPRPEKASTPDAILRALEEFQATKFESEEARLRRQFEAIQLGRRQGFVSDAQYSEARQGFNRLMIEQWNKEQEQQLRELTSLMSEFGVRGDLALSKQTEDLGKLNQAYREGKISLQDLKEATSSYYQTLEENANRPALKKALEMFRQGMINSDELDRARSRSILEQGYSKRERQYEEGDINAYELARYREEEWKQMMLYREGRQGNYYQTPGGDHSYRQPYLDAPTLNPKTQSSNAPSGSINLVALDHFSEQFIRRLKQQGLLTA